MLFIKFPDSELFKVYSGGVVALENVFIKNEKSALKEALFVPSLLVSRFLFRPLSFIEYTSLFIEPFSTD